ncbi:hypothetical protein ACTWQB_16495 [Piscibacillus sp. B03]
MYFELSVFKKGQHLFSTDERSIQNEAQLKYILKEFKQLNDIDSLI